MSLTIALGMFAAVPPLAASALTFNCDTHNEGQVMFRLFDLYDKRNAIYTTCTLPNLPGVTGEGNSLPGSANDKAKSMVSVGYSNYQGTHGYICITFYSGYNFTGYMFTEIVVEGVEHWFNFPAGTENRISSWESYYCYD